MNKLIAQLKESGQDFEFYPTTKEMVRTIFEHRRTPYSDRSGFRVDDFGTVLDIGCGTCNFKRFVDELNKPLERHDGRYTDRSKCVTIQQYYVMEKSRILLDRLPADAVVLGVDFHENTLIDKPVDTIFCNPPYSEYEDWVAKIITESACKSIYLIIPQRWKNSEKIQLALKQVKPVYHARNNYADEEPFEVLGSFDFLDAERSARAKVDVVFINKSCTDRASGFDKFFDEVFSMGSSGDKFDFQSAEYREEMKNELLTGRNKIETLCNGYAAAQDTLFNHFKVICGLDADILETIGVQKKNVKEALKMKFAGLKTLYWNLAFDCLEEITSRLTSTSREKMKNRFDKLLTVDFNAANVYSLVIWVIKNANDYYKNQMIDFFMAMSSPENVQNYKSNQRVFTNDGWGYRNQKHSHYTLDYRIVCTRHALPGEGETYRWNPTLEQIMSRKISDVCTVANNLGFHISGTIFPADYGQKGYVMMEDGVELFEFKCYRNGNVHLKFNKEFIKALNVEVSRELGWIHNREDIAREFVPEMAAGAEKYFDKTLKIGLSSVPQLMNS